MRRHQRLRCPAEYPLYTAYISSASCSSACRSSECEMKGGCPLPRLWVQLLPSAHVSVTGVCSLLIGFLVQSPGAFSNLQRNSGAKRATPTLFIPLEELMQTRQLILVETHETPEQFAALLLPYRAAHSWTGDSFCRPGLEKFRKPKICLGPAK
jgi:hypothetical protein